MCVPESALRYYEEQLEREYEAQEHGYDSYEEYHESMLDDRGNRDYDNWKEERTLND